MQAKLRQKLLTLIPAPTDKALLQEMFDAGMTIKCKPDGGYIFKQSSLENKRWEKFKDTASKNIKSALQQLTLSLEETENESDTLKPAQVEGDVLSNGIKTGKRQPVKKEEPPANITLEQYSTITFAEYKRQRLLQMRLYEISYIPMLQELRSIIDEMLQSGIVLKDDERYGFKIEPIIGEGYYTLEKWQDITNRIKGNADVLRELKEKLKKLSEVQKKPMYSICCENRKSECAIVHDSCYLSSCKLALKIFDEKLQKEYTKLNNTAPQS